MHRPLEGFPNFASLSHLSDTPRDYSPWFKREGFALEDNGHGTVVRLYRRTGKPEELQLARAYRGSPDGFTPTEQSIYSPRIMSDIPEYLYELEDALKSVAADPVLEGCTIPFEDLLHSILVSWHDFSKPALVSTTPSAEYAEELWPHLPLIVANVPIDNTVPVSALVKAYFGSQGDTSPVSPNEVGVIGFIDTEWLVEA